MFITMYQKNKVIDNETVWILENNQSQKYVPRSKLVLQEWKKEISNKSIINLDTQEHLISMSQRIFHCMRVVGEVSLDIIKLLPQVVGMMFRKSTLHE